MDGLNSTLPGNATNSILDDPGPIYRSYTTGYFFIGLFITLAASLLNAFGINLQKLDHTRAQASPSSARWSDCLRPVWLLGLTLYIVSQLLGSTLALQYMRAEYVAPLGSASLIFNFVFARFLLGTSITRLDLFGTLTIVLGVVGVIGFGNIRRSGYVDPDANLSLDTLRTLWARLPWVGYLIGLEVVTAGVLWMAGVMEGVIEEREADERDRGDGQGDDDLAFAARGGGRRSTSQDGWWHAFLTRHRRFRSAAHVRIASWASSRPASSLDKLCGLAWALGAGLLAGQTLIMAKSFVKLVGNVMDQSGNGSDLVQPVSVLIVIFLVVTGVGQVFCLNKGLIVYDSTLIVPVLFAAYTASGFIDSLIYLHEFPIYRSWVLAMIWLCIAVLVGGVVMLSSKKPESASAAGKKGEAARWRTDEDPEGEAQGTAVGNVTPVRARSGSVMSLTELEEELRMKLGRGRSRSSVASNRTVRSAPIKGSEAASGLVGRAAPTSAPAHSDEEDTGTVVFSRPEDDDEEEGDEIDALKGDEVDGEGLPAYGQLKSHDGDEEDFGVFVDAKQ